MPQAILGKKVGMTQIFSAEGKIIPVTVIEAGPCVIAQVKTKANDGYEAIQIGFGSIKDNALNKAEAGHAKKANIAPQRYLKEIRVADTSEYQAGQEIKADTFTEGDLIDVIGTSKGKGFAGTIKRWNHHRGPMSHGSHNHRRPSSAGAKGPARVFKGKKSPGRLGGERVTVQNLELVKVDAERNLLLVKGAIPGPKKALVIVRSAIKASK